MRSFDKTSFDIPASRHHLLKKEIERLNRLDKTVRVLEWGSGLSTILLCDMLKQESSILSIEHDRRYEFKIPEVHKSRLTQKILDTQKGFGSSDAYCTYPVVDVIEHGQGYDLILIDGRNRADCLGVAALLLTPDGRVILCDSQREKYHRQYKLFRSIISYPTNNSAYRTALLKDSVCGGFTATGELSDGKSFFHLPERQKVPCSWGVCAVALPRESYYWIKDWIDHHIKAGARKIVIYDNTGSVTSQRGYSVFNTGRYQQRQVSKRGEEYGKLTSHLTDEQIRDDLRKLAASYDGLVEIIEWKPLHSDRNVIVHGQVEAYCDFIRRYRETLGWGLFIDLDEYIYCRPGLTMNGILSDLEKDFPEVSVLHLWDWEYECRWGEDGPKDITTHMVHHPSGHDCGKTLARLQDVTHANIHCYWTLKKHAARFMPHREDMAFAHYKRKPEDLRKDGVQKDPRAFLKTAPDPSMKPRFKTQFDITDNVIGGLPVDTTFVKMAQSA